MKHVAIVYSSGHGHTAKIVAYMAQLLEIRGCVVQRYNIDEENPQLEAGVDTVIYGSPLYIGRMSAKLLKWLRAHHATLRSKTLACFMVSLNHQDASAEARANDEFLLRTFVSRSGLVPRYIVSLSGCLAYTQYGFLVKRQMREIASRAGGSVDTTKDHDYTNWDDVMNFAHAIVDRAEQTPFLSASRLRNRLDLSVAEFEHGFLLKTDIRASSLQETFDAASRQVGDRELEFALSRRASQELVFARVGHISNGLFYPIAILSGERHESLDIPGATQEFMRLGFSEIEREKIRVTFEFRGHSLDANERGRARLYYAYRLPLMKLRAALLLRRLKKQLEQKTPHPTPVSSRLTQNQVTFDD